jgi:hypothetical protein
VYCPLTATARRYLDKALSSENFVKRDICPDKLRLVWGFIFDFVFAESGSGVEQERSSIGLDLSSYV